MTFKIEKYQEKYRSEIEKMLTEDDFVKEDILLCLKDFPECAVMAVTENDLAAIGIYTGKDKMTSMTFYVSPDRRQEGIGSFILTSLEKEMQESGVAEIVCDFLLNDTINSFLDKRGYDKWFRSNHMIYTGNEFNVGQISVSNYSDGDYETVQKIFSEAFHKMRLSVGLQSTLAESSEEERSTYLKKTEDIFVLRKNEEITAAVMVENNEIDKLAVAVDKQGLGYGKELLGYTVNKLRERGFTEISLWVVEGNPAKALYEKSGFKINRLHEFMKKKLI